MNMARFDKYSLRIKCEKFNGTIFIEIEEPSWVNRVNVFNSGETEQEMSLFEVKTNEITLDNLFKSNFWIILYVNIDSTPILKFKVNNSSDSDFSFTHGSGNMETIPANKTESFEIMNYT